MSAIKNHIMVNGQLLQTNKKWSHLKRKQLSWIYEITKEKHAAYVMGYGKLPPKGAKKLFWIKFMTG
jgi:hypothetical protein